MSICLQSSASIQARTGRKKSLKNCSRQTTEGGPLAGPVARARDLRSQRSSRPRALTRRAEIDPAGRRSCEAPSRLRRKVLSDAEISAFGNRASALHGPTDSGRNSRPPQSETPRGRI
jgi:hypothetical protein